MPKRNLGDQMDRHRLDDNAAKCRAVSKPNDTARARASSLYSPSCAPTRAALRMPLKERLFVSAGSGADVRSKTCERTSARPEAWLAPNRGSGCSRICDPAADGACNDWPATSRLSGWEHDRHRRQHYNQETRSIAEGGWEVVRRVCARGRKRGAQGVPQPKASRCKRRKVFGRSRLGEDSAYVYIRPNTRGLEPRPLVRTMLIQLSYGVRVRSAVYQSSKIVACSRARLLLFRFDNVNRNAVPDLRAQSVRIRLMRRSVKSSMLLCPSNFDHLYRH